MTDLTFYIYIIYSTCSSMVKDNMEHSRNFSFIYINLAINLDSTAQTSERKRRKRQRRRG